MSFKFECCICFDEINKLKNLQQLKKCDHVICQKCYDNIMDNDSIKCPLCREITKVNEIDEIDEKEIKTNGLVWDNNLNNFIDETGEIPIYLRDGYINQYDREEREREQKQEQINRQIISTRKIREDRKRQMDKQINFRKGLNKIRSDKQINRYIPVTNSTNETIISRNIILQVTLNNEPIYKSPFN